MFPVIIRNVLAKDMNNPDSLIRIPHKRYYINKIMIFPEYDAKSADTIKYDTVLFIMKSPYPKKPCNTILFPEKRKVPYQSENYITLCLHSA